MSAELAHGDVLAALTGMLADVTGEDGQWAAAVTPASRLEGDLRLESVEVAALATRLHETYGEQVDLLGFIAGLGIDEIIGLTVADVVAYVSDRIRGPAAARADG
jgi:hypothetical protein